jgi:hypothetical protein
MPVTETSPVGRIAIRGDLFELPCRLLEALQQIVGVVEAPQDVCDRPETGLRQVGSQGFGLGARGLRVRAGGFGVGPRRLLLGTGR